MSIKSLQFSAASFLIFLAIINFDLINNLHALKITFVEHQNGTFQWHDCLFRTIKEPFPIVNAKCKECMENGTRLARNADKYFMRYRNCTLDCEWPTLCTEYEFNYNGTWRPECYACEAGPNENAAYKAVPITELCGKDCIACALKADLASATACHSECKGKPTFCPNSEPLFYGQRICYQSTKLHGCRYAPVDPHLLKRKYGKNCVDCAFHVRLHHADVCSHHCGNLPAYHTHIVHTSQEQDSSDSNEVRNSVVQKDVIVLFLCEMANLGAVLEYEIPDYVRKLLNTHPNSSLPMLHVQVKGGPTGTKTKVL